MPKAVPGYHWSSFLHDPKVNLTRFAVLLSLLENLTIQPVLPYMYFEWAKLLLEIATPKMKLFQVEQTTSHAALTTLSQLT